MRRRAFPKSRVTRARKFHEATEAMLCAYKQLDGQHIMDQQAYEPELVRDKVFDLVNDSRKIRMAFEDAYERDRI